MIDAARRASAYKVIAVIPYYGWARQDRKDKPRVSIGAKLIADMLTVAGIDRVFWIYTRTRFKASSTFVDHLYSSTILFLTSNP